MLMFLYFHDFVYIISLHACISLYAFWRSCKWQLAFHNAVYTINASVGKCWIFKLDNAGTPQLISCFASEDGQFKISTAQHRFLWEIVRKQHDKNSSGKREKCREFWTWKQPAESDQKIKRTSRHDKRKPALPERTEPRYSVQKSRSEPCSICPWILYQTQTRERERERRRVRCVCVSGHYCCVSLPPSAGHLHLHLHLIIFQTLLSKATYNWGVRKAIKLEEATYRGSARNTQVSGIVQINTASNG